MGLDMYLDERVYIGAEYEHRKVTGNIDIKINGHFVVIPFNRVKDITLRAGYWRKANSIHKWFVDNVQEGKDDCKAYYVLHEDLQELKDLCQKILDLSGDEQKAERKKIIEEKLPPESGFFFGNAEVESNPGLEYYLADLQDTVKIIQQLNPEGDYYYQSSW